MEKNAMRLHQISPEEATSIDEPINIVLIPVRCTCTAVPEDEHLIDDDLKIYIGGMPIKDIKVTSMVNFGWQIKITFGGTAIFYTTGGVKDALERLYQVPIEIWTDRVVGLGQASELEVCGVITLVTPDGKVVQLAGADR